MFRRSFDLCKILCLLVLLSTAAMAEGVAPFVHPGLLNNLDELNFFKRKVEAGAEPWTSAYKQRVAAGRYAALDFTPDITPGSIDCRNMTTDTNALRENQCVDQMSLDMQAAYSHALQWFVEQHRNPRRAEQHARKSIQILNHWFGANGIKSWTGSRKRYAGYLTATGVYAAEIIRHTYQGWNPAEIKQVEATLENVVWNFIKDGHPTTMNARFSNQEGSAVMGKIAIAIFLSDREKFNNALAHYRRHLADNIYYKHPTQPDFKNYETCRDLGHTQVTLSNMTAGAEMAWKQGVDLYSLRDNILLKSIEFQLRFILDEPNKPNPKCENDPNPNTQKRVEVRDPKAFYEAAYHHYHDRMKLEAERLRRVIAGSYKGNQYRPENNPIISDTKGTGVGFGWGTLTHAGLPPYPAGHRPKGGDGKSASSTRASSKAISTASPEQREQVNIGGDTYSIEWLHKDDFDQSDWAKNWIKEGPSHVGVSNNRLLVTKPSGSGGEATIWFRPPLPANLIVRYKAKALGSDINNKCNLNQITHATESDGTSVKFGSRGGDYKEYHRIPNYIVTFTFDHSRVRRDPGFNQLSETRDQAQPDKEYDIAVVVKDGRIRYYINNRRVHDVQDANPLPAGRFAIRTWNTTAWWDDFEFGRVL